jgi:hypothetical protein
MARYETAAQEWSAKYRRLHARPGTRTATISLKGARILKMLSPFPWEGSGPDIQGVGDKAIIQWGPLDDDFVVGHAHDAPFTGFPRGDAAAILRGFEAQHQYTDPATRSEYRELRGSERRRRGFSLTRHNGRPRYRRR